MHLFVHSFIWRFIISVLVHSCNQLFAHSFITTSVWCEANTRIKATSNFWAVSKPVATLQSLVLGGGNWINQTTTDVEVEDLG